MSIDALNLFYKNLVELDNKFANISLKLRRSRLNEADIKEALEIIKDEKFIFRQPKRVLDKINFLKKTLEAAKLEIPNELYYREAAVYFEIEENYEKALELFLNLFKNSDDNDIYKEHSAFFIIKIYLKFYNFDHTSYACDYTITKENLAKAKEFIVFLMKKYLNKSLKSEIVSFSFSDILRKFEQISKIQEDLVIEDLKIYKITKNKTSIEKTIENLEKHPTEEDFNFIKKKFNIFIDYTLAKVFINSNSEEMTKNQINLLISFVLEKKIDTNIIQRKFDIDYHPALKRIQRMRNKLRELNIKISDDYIFEDIIKLAIFYDNNNKDFLEHFL